MAPPVPASFPEMNKKKRARAIVFVFLTVVIDFLGLMLTIPIMANFARLVQGEPGQCVIPGRPSPMVPGQNGYCGNATIALPAAFAVPSPSDGACAAANASFFPSDCDGARTDANANVGLVSSAYAVASLISSMWMPIVSDRYGRRLAFFLSLLGSGGGFALMALSNSFTMLVAVRFLAGLFGGSATVANSYITDVYAPAERGAMFARLGVTIISTVSLGPTLGAALASAFGLRGPLYVATMLSAVALLFAFKFVLEPSKLRLDSGANGGGVGAGGGGADSSSAKNPLIGAEAASVGGGSVDGDGAGQELATVNKRGAKDVGGGGGGGGGGGEEDSADAAHTEVKDRYNAWCEPFNVAIGFQTFLSSLSFNGISSLMALLLQGERYGVIDATDSLDKQGRDMSTQIALNALTISLCTMPSMLLMMPKCSKRIGLLRTGAIGNLLFGAALYTVPHTDSIAFLVPVLAALGVANGMQSNVSTQSLASRAPPKHVAQTLAVGTMCDSAAGMVGPMLTQLYRISDSFPYVIAAACAWLGSLTLLFVSARFAGASRIGLEPAGEKEGEAEEHARQARRGSVDHAGTGGGTAVPEQGAAPPLVLGVPEFDEAALARAMFKGKPGVDYNEHFARDLAGHFRVLYETLARHNHTLPWRASIGVLEREQKEDFHGRVMTVQRELIAGAFPHLTADPGRKQFKQDVYDMLMGLGHDDWAAGIPGVAHAANDARKVIPH